MINKNVLSYPVDKHRVKSASQMCHTIDIQFQKIGWLNQMFFICETKKKVLFKHVDIWLHI
jgi:hypothetical protein